MVVEGNINYVKYFTYLINFHKSPTNNIMAYLLINSDVMHYQHAQVFYYNHIMDP
jgi:hypothetical protein